MVGQALCRPVQDLRDPGGRPGPGGEPRVDASLGAVRGGARLRLQHLRQLVGPQVHPEGSLRRQEEGRPQPGRGDRRRRGRHRAGHASRSQVGRGVRGNQHPGSQRRDEGGHGVADPQGEPRHGAPLRHRVGRGRGESDAVSGPAPGGHVPPREEGRVGLGHVSPRMRRGEQGPREGALGRA